MPMLASHPRADKDAARAEDGAAAPETYRPHTTAGAYVPTTTPAVTQWPQRTPWPVQEVSHARIWGGVHYRTSTEVGTQLGRQVGELAVHWMRGAL
jgi:hypothetical protein